MGCCPVRVRFREGPSLDDAITDLFSTEAIKSERFCWEFTSRPR
jgi:hypothetical protein